MKNSLRNSIMLIFLSIFTVLAISLRCIACFTELDFVTGFFYDTTLITISNTIVTVLLSVLLLSLFVKIEQKNLLAKFTGPLCYLPAGVLAVALFFAALRFFEYAAGPFGTIFTSDIFSHPSYTIAVFVAILAMLSIGYFAISVFVSARTNLLRASFSMIVALFFAMNAIFLFFKQGAPMNLPSKIIDEMTFLSVAVFFIYETRISLGREMWKNYFVFGFIGAVLTAYSALPNLIIYTVNGKVVSDNIETSLLFFGAMLFIIFRLIKASLLDEDKPSPFALAINAKKEEDNKFEETEELEPPQISIEDIEE